VLLLQTSVHSGKNYYINKSTFPAMKFCGHQIEFASILPPNSIIHMREQRRHFRRKTARRM